MAENYLLVYSEQLAINIELMCQSIKASSNILFQIRKSSSSVYVNIREANYGQSKPDNYITRIFILQVVFYNSTKNAI